MIVNVTEVKMENSAKENKRYTSLGTRIILSVLKVIHT